MPTAAAGEGKEAAGRAANRKGAAAFTVGDRVHVWSNSTHRWLEDGVVKEVLSEELDMDCTRVLPHGSLRVVFGGGVRMKWVTPQEQGSVLRKAPAKSEVRAAPTPQRASAGRPAGDREDEEMLAELLAAESRCRREGRPFVDSDFAPVLGGRVREWCRPQDITFHGGQSVGGWAGELSLVTQAMGLPDLGLGPKADWQLFRGPPVADDVQQGEVGDCWFLSSLAALAEFQGGVFVRSLLPGQEACSESGVYLVRLCLGGRWHWTLVDDRLPCLGGGVTHKLLAHCETQRQQLWASIIEKAAAKAVGSYEGLHLGEAREALSMFTGWPCKNIDFRRRDFNPDILWATLSSSRAAGFLVACGTFAVLTSSLIPHHIYSVLDVFDLVNPRPSGRPVRLLKIRNPQIRNEKAASKKWNGAWCDTSPLWTPELRRQVGCLEGGTPGIFFMALEDFAKHFAHCTICRIQSGDWHEARETLDLPGSRSSEFALTLEVAEDTEVSLSLSQPEERMRGGPLHRNLSKHMALMGFVLLRLLPEGRAKAVAKASLRREPLVSAGCWLEPGSYLVMPMAVHRESIAIPAGFACFSSRPVALAVQRPGKGAAHAAQQELGLQASKPVRANPRLGSAAPGGRATASSSIPLGECAQQ